jgi:hypothetical protein
MVYAAHALVCRRALLRRIGLAGWIASGLALALFAGVCVSYYALGLHR